MIDKFKKSFSLSADRLSSISILNNKLVRTLLFSIAAIFFLLVIATPFSLFNQVLFATTMFAVAYVLNALNPGRLATLILISLSIVASLRYMFWRVTETLGFERLIDAMFGYGLFLAEIYALVVLLFSYFQSAWPLRRPPILMPASIQRWPTVDIFIPTYNEPLNIVQQTVLTALSQDWPKDKYTIYVLDDGRREEFKAFCEEVGVGYMTRNDNKNAKAGNINEALKKTHGEFIAIFDCDHVPTRSFLQVCMGWFLKDEKLAMLQTPHVFFSPDPLEQNLDVFHKVPNEGQLFYGLTQDGNDLWNATFFCGSCAVLRRSALEEVGGVAVESVTEDALTALKLNQLGYNTAYLAVPQAAGLATESLSRHIGQRIRWARGMTQIFRNFNPLLARGLSWAQRICYTSAVLHFFYGLPRLVFLTAPLAYLFFGAHVFDASALMIAAYALPHIVHAQLTNSRVQGRFRHSFWNEVYETVLAWYIMRPTLATLIAPNKATFNVTQKGGTVDEAFFDWDLSKPYIVLLILNILGLLVGAVKMYWGWHDQSVVLTVLINVIWTIHNVVITSASVAVAGEQKQIRSAPRVRSNLSVSLILSSGHRYRCVMTDFSQNGLGLITPVELERLVGEQVRIELARGDTEHVFDAQVVFSQGKKIGLLLLNLCLEQQVELAQLTFARADIWAVDWNNVTPDSPWLAIRQIGRISRRGMSLLIKESWKAIRIKPTKTGQTQEKMVDMK